MPQTQPYLTGNSTRDAGLNDLFDKVRERMQESLTALASELGIPDLEEAQVFRHLQSLRLREINPDGTPKCPLAVAQAVGNRHGFTVPVGLWTPLSTGLVTSKGTDAAPDAREMDMPEKKVSLQWADFAQCLIDSGRSIDLNTQGEIEDRAGVAVRTISRLKAGQSISFETAIKLLEAVGKDKRSLPRCLKNGGGNTASKTRRDPLKSPAARRAETQTRIVTEPEGPTDLVRMAADLCKQIHSREKALEGIDDPVRRGRAYSNVAKITEAVRDLVRLILSFEEKQNSK